MPEEATIGRASDCCSKPPVGKDRFDLAVLGGGSAAFAAALRASELGRFAASPLQTSNAGIFATMVDFR